MSERPTLFRLERDGVVATIVLDNPTNLNAWSWESARQVTAIAVPSIKRTVNFRAEQGLAEAMQFEAASAAVLFTSDDMQLGYKAMAKKEDAHFEGK